MNVSHYDPLHPHTHEPNPLPPSPDTAFKLLLPNHQSKRISIEMLSQLPQTKVANCYIVSTGHGTSGPFCFSGVTLLDFIKTELFNDEVWQQLEVISGDGFGTRLTKKELVEPDLAGPILLAITLDGNPLTREQGAVRLIVPNETDDALRQVKWIGEIRVR